MNQNPLLELQGRGVFAVNFLWERMEGRRETLATVKRHWVFLEASEEVASQGAGSSHFPKTLEHTWKEQGLFSSSPQNSGDDQGTWLEANLRSQRQMSTVDFCTLTLRGSLRC